MRSLAHARARTGLVIGLALAALGAPRLLAEGTSKAALYAPVDMEVVDVEATIAIATKAGERLPLVLVHDPAVGAEVGVVFDAAFAQTRAVFMDRLQATFGVATLDVVDVGEAAFREFRAEFQKNNPLFPVSPALAQTWARGFDGEPIRERIAALLRAFHRDQLIGEIRPASSVFVVAPGTGAGARAWGEVAPHARVVEPTAVLTIASAGDLLRRMNDPLDRAAGGYLSGLLRGTVAEDSHLTGLLLRDRIGGAVVQRSIARGAGLSEAGHPVDAWAPLALAQLARLGIQPLDAPPSSDASASAATAGAPTGESLAPGGVAGGWWIAGVIVVLIGATGGGVVVWRSRVRGSRAIELSTAGAAGEAMIPHLARELKDRLVRALFTQRSVLLANEQAASRRVQEMEERLARLQPAIAEKIRGYEQRIESLEKEIAERDAETRDLLRAKLVLARKELDAEISRNRLDWN